MFKLVLGRATCCLLTTLTVAAASSQGRLEEKGAIRRFISDKYGFSLLVPSGWSVTLFKDTPTYINFDPSKVAPRRPEQLPAGGAEIDMVAQVQRGRRSAMTLSEWAADVARAPAEHEPRIRPFEMPLESEAGNAIWASYDDTTYRSNEQVKHCVVIFWEFRQRRFAGYLDYVPNDPGGPEIERTFFEIVRSLRPHRIARLR